MAVVVEVAIALKIWLLGLRAYVVYKAMNRELLKYRRAKRLMHMAKWRCVETIEESKKGVTEGTGP